MKKFFLSNGMMWHEYWSDEDMRRCPVCVGKGIIVLSTPDSVGDFQTVNDCHYCRTSGLVFAGGK